MKKNGLLAMMFLSALILTACAGTEGEVNKPATAGGEKVAEVKEEIKPIPFAEVGNDIMDATKDYKLFRFLEGEGTCMEQGFPTNLVYASPNMIKTEDEKYVEDMTAVDFTGRISFNELPLGDTKVACDIKTIKGITTAQMTCYTGTGDEKKEQCTASFKVYAEKK